LLNILVLEINFRPLLVAIKNELDPRPDRSYYMLVLEFFGGI
jgi:hypothetical protein